MKTMKQLVAAGVCSLVCTLAQAGIVNGDFSNGFTGWTMYTTADGRLTPNGPGGTIPPTTRAFDTDGNGASSLAAEFRVGQREPFESGVWGGGGIFQSFLSGAGLLSLSIDVAAQHETGAGSSNMGGLFELLIDGLVVDSWNVGAILVGQTLRSELTYSGLVDAGEHELRIQMTRPFLTGRVAPNFLTPLQYIDDVILDAPAANAVPIPGSLVLASLALMGLGLSRKQRKA